MSAFAAPSGPPPSHQTQTQNQAQNPASFSADDDILNDPPPAYTPTAATASTGAGPSSSSTHPAAGHGETTLETGPSRMDFSGPPPLPDRLQNNITGVGEGYGRRPEHALGSRPTGGSTHSAWGVNPQHTGTNVNAGDNGWRPPPPPQHPSGSASTFSGYSAPSGPPPPSSSGGNGKDNPFADANATQSSSGAGPSRPSPSQQQQDTSPTEAPTPGRPLLHRGQLLVYPKGHWCHKCGNTGYKANDPSNPHESDWKKYGKPYNSALATSYTTFTNPNTNPSVTSSANFQRPLPSFPPQHQQNQNPYGHLPPPPGSGSWGSYPGQNAHFAPHPPPPQPPQQHYMPHMGYPSGGHHQQQQIFVQKTPGPIPPGALVVGPGDPRIGGVPCHRCGGSGREVDFFFGFDEGRCYACRGLGRVF
ncbi:hypothetical protein IAT40_007643 [Kwoniella sp. CBS 6097]